MHIAGPPQPDSQPLVKNAVFIVRLVESVGVKSMDIRADSCIYWEKNPGICEPSQFRPMLFQGQLLINVLCNPSPVFILQNFNSVPIKELSMPISSQPGNHRSSFCVYAFAYPRDLIKAKSYSICLFMTDLSQLA